MRLSRADRSLVADWWFSIDRRLLTLVFVLMTAGLVISLAASPPAAQKLRLDQFHFVIRHAVFLGLSVGVFIAASMLSPRQLRQMSLVMALVGFVFMAAAFAQGYERNGAIRWLSLGAFSLQPSEFAKPGFIVLSAWLLSEGMRRNDVPALPMAAGFLALFVILLALQPDVGQALLVTVTWGCLFFLAGYSVKWLALLGAAMAGGLALAYVATNHVKSRIDQFLAPGGAANSQSEIAFNAFREGGWFGRGPGEGALKMNLPDAHTDYVFAVVAEEFGIISCLFIVVIYALIAWRGVRVRVGAANDFENLAKTGLTMLLTLQALANMAVNVNLLPAKGVTLPLISYGGSSMLSVAALLGMVLALSRRRADGHLPGHLFQFEAGPAASREMHI
ncbi:MAG: putative peptidoglycan glycosyltransferase FtsW [Hyphomicrobiales bacterium]|nr:putative peptidoglycan glycosyltransferase FtsW [Hyphomicrobiales bacterium]